VIDDFLCSCTVQVISSMLAACVLSSIADDPIELTTMMAANYRSVFDHQQDCMRILITVFMIYAC